MNIYYKKYIFIILAAGLLLTPTLAQTAMTFTNAAATGRLGPTQTQVTAAYDNTTLDDAVTINTQGIQEWTLPATATYTIEVYGAQGGRSYLRSTSTWYDGGKGAKMVADFNLSQGDVLKIVVGQQGVELARNDRGAGGGGGTYVVLSSGNSLLIAAGGGGGAGDYAYSGHGQTSTSGTAGGSASGNTGGGAGGTGGGGGNKYTYGSGGAGWLSNGQNGSSTTGGIKFSSGGQGGTGYSGTNGSDGGFGGGGGSYAGAGGGGGYSGGGGGAWSYSGNGGGGGSYTINTASNTSSMAGENEDHGKVIITYCDGFCFESASLAANNSYVDVTISAGAYNTNGGSGALEASDFALTFAQNGGTATAAAISSIKKNDNTAEGSATALSGGETVIRMFLSITGTPTGVESILIKPASGSSIYNSAGTAMAVESGISKNLNDLTAAYITGTTIAATNATVAVTFSEAVYNGGIGNDLEASDFTLSISGGVATLSSATPTSISIGGNTYTLGIGLSSAASGSETLTVNPALNSIYDANDNVSSTSQSNNTVTLHDQRLSVKQTLEHDGSNGIYNSLVRMNHDTYLLMYQGYSYFPFLSTFTIDSDGNPITEVASLQLSTSQQMTWPSLVQMTEDTYIVAFYGYDSGTDYNGNAITNQIGQWISTFKVKPDGSVIKKLGALRHDTENRNAPYHSLVKVDDDTYALAYLGKNYGPSGGGSNGGWIKTFTVNGATITQTAQLKHWTSWSYYNSWVQADANTYVLAWSDNHSDGRVTTFTIPADGSSITEVAELEYDTDQAKYQSIAKVDGDTYVVADQTTSSKGQMTTFTIPNDGSTITKVAQITHSESFGFWNSMIPIDENKVMLAYSGNSTDGYVKIFQVPSDGSSITEKLGFEHETSLGRYHSLVQVDFDTYALAYGGPQDDGYMRTFDYALTAATINPRISSVSIAAVNSTIAVTFNEAVFNATGGSGALQANDFALALSGGSATLGSATPTSISISGNVYTLGMNISGTPNGFEHITITPVNNSIYDATDNEASTSQLMNQAYLHDKVGPSIASTGSLGINNSTVEVTFGEPVFNTSGGALETSDFTFGLSGGTATGATVSSISISEITYTLGITIAGIANGSETLIVTPVANSIYDMAGNAASTTQSNNTVSLLDGRIAIVTSHDHDTNYGKDNRIIRMDSDTYLLAYKGGNGYLKTFTIPADGSTVTQEAYLQHASSTVYQQDLLQIDSDTYILAYGGYSATTGWGQHIKTFKVKPDGSSIIQIGDLLHDTYNHSNNYASLVKVDHDTYALAYYGKDQPSTNQWGSWIKTFTVNGGTITEVAKLKHYTSTTSHHSFVKVDADTYALAYAGSGNDGYIKTFTIPADGSSITQAGEFEHDTDQARYNSFVHFVGGGADTYVLSYQGPGDDGFIKTFTISADGTTITQVAALEHDQTYAIDNSLIKTNVNTFALAYGGDGDDGYIKTFTIPADGSSITQVITLEHNQSNGRYNSLVQIDADSYALAYYDEDNDGQIRTFNTVAAATSTVPRISSVALAADNSTVAVTFNEPVYSTNGGSGSLEKHDFGFSISGGTATLSSGNRPSSISASGNTYTLGLSLTGTASGSERLFVGTPSNSIFDAQGNAASNTQATSSALLNMVYLNDKTAPTIASTSINNYNTGITVTFSETVFPNTNASGSLTTGDFTLALNGGTATLSSTTPSSISASGNSYNLGLSLSGMTDGNEVITVTPVANSIYDTNGKVASTTQSNNTATLAKSLIGEVASLEHDNSNGTYNSFVQIAPNKYAVAYAGSGDDGYIKTFTIASDGTITQIAVKEHDEDNGTYNSLVKVDDNTYALAYTGNGNDGFIKTFTIPADGSTIELVAQWEHDTNQATYNSFTQVDSNTYALAYTGSGNDGYIKTFTISSDGSNIAVVQTKEHDANEGQHNSFIRMDSDTYLLAYSGYQNDGYIKTFTIPADGSTITQVQSLEHDPYRGYYNSLVQIDYNTYALAYSGGTSTYTNSYYYGLLKTFTIPPDGSSITQVKSFQNNTINNTGTYHSLIKINSEEYALAYAGYGNDGFIDNFTISSDGDSIKKVWSLEHDTNTGTNNSLIMVDKDTYALAYSGSGNDGYIKTFNIVSSDQTAPKISYVSLPYDNSTLTLAFNEAVYNTNGSSGSLEASDFVLSITGGTATVAGTPTSILASLGNTYTLGFSLSGTPDGNEVLKVVPATNAIYDANGNVSTTTQSNNTVNLNEKVVPTITAVSLASDNSTLAVTFSESVYNSSSGSGNLVVSDFVFSITGGTATLASATPSSLSKSGNVYTLGITYTGLPNGNEVIKVVPASNAIWDGAGNLASTTQSNNTASFNEERIRAVTSKEHNISYGTYNSIVKVDDDTYALAYSGSGNDGYIQTFTIPADGTTITEVKSLEHDTGQGKYNSLVHVSGTTYALAYSDASNDGWIKTFSISDDGSTITQLTALEHAGAFAIYNSIIQLDTDTYVLAFNGYGNDGRIKAFTISSNGSISVSAGQVIHDSNLGEYNSLVKVDSNTVALAYSGSGGNGYIKTFTIPSSGASITQVFEYKHDSIYGKHNSFVQVDDDTYALAYSGTGNDGFIKTFTIPVDGSAVTQVTGGKLEHDTANGTFNSLIKVSSGSDTYILAYTGNEDDGYLKTFTISADGTTINQVYVIEYDTNQGRYNSLVQIDMDTYALAYAGTSDDGYVETYLIRANDEIPPTIKNVQLASDNSTIAVTFDEAVYSTNNGSGALDTADFVFSITGGSATLSSAAPTSISVSSNTYTLGIGLSGLADGSEVLTVKPAANAIFDGGYNAASTTQSNNTATLNDRAGPKISSVALAADNSTIAVTLNEASYKTNSGSGSLEKNDFVFSLTGGTATLSSTTPSSISADGNVYTLGITISGTPSGSELLKVTPAENAIYDAKGNAASTTQSNNTANLKDKTAPTVSSVTTASDNKTIVVTFSEAVFNTNGGSGALDSADFVFSITGGAATLADTIPTSISINGNVYTLGIGLSGTPDGNEVVTVIPAENAIYDAGGNAAGTTQTNNTTSLFDQTAPSITSVSIASDNSTISVSFSVDPVYSTNSGSGALDSADFVFSLSGGIATLTDTLPTSLSNSGSTYTLGIGLAGIPNGSEVLKVALADNAVFDGAGNPATGTQTNNTAKLNDKTPPTFTAFSIASNNGSAAITISEPVFSTNSGSGLLDSADFVFSLSEGTATLSKTYPISISTTGNTYTLGIGLSGTPDGSEVLTIALADSAIYDASGNVATTTQSNNTANLKDKTLPTISSVSIAADNGSISVTFNEAVYNTNGGSGTLDSADFAFSLSGGAATLTSITPTSISASSNTYTLGIGLSGTPDGSEVLTIALADSAIYDASGNVATTTQSNNTANLKDKTLPTISSVSTATDSSILVEFNETVFSKSDGSGALDSADFVFSLSGGTATLSKTYPTSISVTGNTYTMGIGLSGTPDGGEVLTVVPAENAIYDATGNVASAAQSNNTANLKDKTLPAISSVSTAADNGSISVTFSEAVFNTNSGSGTLDSADFVLSITGGAATLADTIPTSISVSGNTYTLGLSLSGTPDGSEVLTVVPAENAIYDAAGNAASTTQSNKTTSLFDQTAPNITSVSLAYDNGTVAVTFSVSVYNTASGEGVLDPADFVFSLSGGTATLISTTPTSISASGNTYTLGISLLGTPDGSEVLTVIPAENAIYDEAGNVSSAIQINNTANLKDQSKPVISITSVSSDNSTMAVIFIVPVYSTASGEGVLDSADFVFSLSGGTATLISTTPTSISASGNTYTLGIGLSGTPDGSEVLTVVPADSAIYDAAGNAASTTQTNNTASLNDKAGPRFSSVSLAADNKTIAVTFNEAVFNSDGGSGTLDSIDFVFSLSGGTATLISTTPTSISASGNTYTLGIGLSGTPDGTELLTVVPLEEAIYDAAGNTASATQSNNTINLKDKTPATILSASIASNSSVSATFSEMVFSKNNGSGALDSADFVFSLSGGTATLSSTTPTSISVGGNTYALGISLTGTPDGSEVLTVAPADSAIYDAAGNVATTTQSNNTVILYDEAPPKAPTGFVATPGWNQVNLIWNANSEGDVVKYYIYGGTSLGSNMKMDSTLSVSDTSATITGLINGTVYFFHLTALDSNGYESDKSADLGVTSGLGSTVIVKTDSSANYVSIQAAIDAATIGDTILVYPGIYRESINYDGKSIVVGSLHLTTGDTSYISSTIIDGKNFGSVIKFENFEDSTAILQGFTIRNGLGFGKGGGIYVKGAGKNLPTASTPTVYTSPTLKNLIVRDNQISGGENFYYGGGIYLEFSKAKITDCTFINNVNSSQLKIIDAGGGIYFTKSNPEISNSIIGYNVAAKGAGIYGETDHYSSDTFIRPNFIMKRTKVIGNTGDTTKSYLNGEAIFIETSQAKFENCLIVENNVKSGIQTSAYTAIINSTLADNGGTEGHDIRFTSSDSLVIINSIIFGNGNSIDNVDTTLSSAGYIFIYNTILEGGIAGVNKTTGSKAWTIDSQNILDVNPSFERESVDKYTLKRFSLGIGAGIQTKAIEDKSFSAPINDIAGNPRPFPKPSSPDIGAYESNYSNRFPKSNIISDGLLSDQELDYSNVISSLSAHWKQFDDDSTVTFEYAIGTKVLNNIVDWTDNGTDTSVTAIGLSMDNDTTYYYSVRGTDINGQVSDTTTTDGVFIDHEFPVIKAVTESTSDQDWYGLGKIGKIVTMATDNSSIAKYEFSVGTIADSANIVAWFIGDSNSVSINLSSFTESVNYYSNARVTDIAGNNSEVKSSDGFQMDLTAPVAGTVATTQTASNEITFSWSRFSDHRSGISYYECSLGSQPGSANVVARTNVGLKESVTLTGLDLKPDTIYYGTVYAMDLAGNVAGASSNGFQIDVTAPNPGTVTTEQTASDEITLSWTGFSDEGKGISYYDYSLGSQPDSGDVVARTNVGLDKSVTLTGLTLEHNAIYYGTVYAVDLVGNEAFAISEGLTIDQTGPTLGTIADGDGDDIDWSNDNKSVSSNWSGFEDDKGITKYEVALGSEAKGTDVKDWTNVDTTTSHTFSDLSLSDNTQYFFSVKATDGLGNVSEVGSSDGFTIDMTAPSITAVSIPTTNTLPIFDNVSIEMTLSEPVLSGKVSFKSAQGDNVGFTQNIENQTKINISLTAPFTSGDEFTLTVNDLTDRAGNVTNYLEYEYNVALLADYDADGTIGLIDLSTFVTGWEADSFDYELGPVTGTVPHFKPAPDGVYNNRDGMVFVWMWHWDKNKSGKMLAKLLANQGADLNTTTENDHILFNPPSETQAIEILLDYPVTDIEFSVPASKAVSEKGLTLSKVDTLNGHLILNAAYFEANSMPVRIDYNHLQKKDVTVNLTYQFIGKDNIVLSSGSEVLEFEPMPREFALHHNYPNPFNPVTTINYDLPRDTHVKLVIYDILGQEVIKLVNGQVPAGYQSVVWNTRNKFGELVSAGIYLYQIQTSGFIKTRKMVLLK